MITAYTPTTKGIVYFVHKCAKRLLPIFFNSDSYIGEISKYKQDNMLSSFKNSVLAAKVNL